MIKDFISMEEAVSYVTVLSILRRIVLRILIISLKKLSMIDGIMEDLESKNPNGND